MLPASPYIYIIYILFSPFVIYQPLLVWMQGLQFIPMIKLSTVIIHEP